MAIVLATLFTCITPSFFSLFDLRQLLARIQNSEVVVDSQAVPTSQRMVRIGIVAGHWGNDSGSVCDNGTTEVEVNLSIASLVQQKLTAQGFQVDLLQEFDPRLDGYQAAVLLSIHNDSCADYGTEATGFKVAAAVGSRDQNLTARLVACLYDRYQRVTGLPFHTGSITLDMTEYHAFDEIGPNTSAAIIETGFLNMDFEILTQRPDLIADGIVAGILCYVNVESVEATPPLNP
ncbi:MAG: N-acetylmuramoyl-L-alanine amidase [Anaerolineales bacterium]|nr:N-acetylmuramoyl-L-alanine amidase [Anaerolineales bacterium]